MKIEYDTVPEGSEDSPVYIGAGEEKEFLLIMNYTGCVSNKNRTITTSGSLTVTADQATEEV